MGRCGIAIVGRSKRLRVNYRTTAQIGSWAVALLHGLKFDDMDEGEDNLNGYHAIRNGLQPEVQHFAKNSQEEAYIVKTLKSWLQENGVQPSHICLTTRNPWELEKRYKPLLEQNDIPVVRLDKDTPESELPAGIRVGTMHRMKGLEFPRVLLAGYSPGSPHKSEHPDQASKADREQRERSLVYVAATRARDLLTVCGYGT